MSFSAYQIESLLEDFQQNNSPVERSTGDTLNISANAKKDSLKFFKPSEESSLDWISPENLSDFVEDTTTYDPIINYVQQSRAGRFVDPVYIPENPAPPFSLVSDHTKYIGKNEHDRKLNIQSLSSENDPSSSDVKSDKLIQEGKKTNLDLNSSADSKEYTKNYQLNSDDQFDTDLNLENQNGLRGKELKNTEKKEEPISAALTFEDIDDDFKDEENQFYNEVLNEENNDDNDVVFGEGPIIQSSIIKFVENFPDSAIKFLLRKNLDGRPLPIEYEEIYQKWELRGLSRSRVKKHLCKLMQWEEFPDIPVIEVLRKIREHFFDMKEKKE